MTNLNYASSGVDINAGNRAVELMKDAVRATYNDRSEERRVGKECRL